MEDNVDEKEEDIKIEKPEINVKDEVISWAKYIIFAFLFAFFITNVLIVNANVPTGSMLNTIPLKSKIVANRLSYLFSKPERFDVIVFKSPDSLPENNPTLTKDDKPILFVKRLIGLPNETIEIKNGLVYIDGSSVPIDEPYLLETPIEDFPLTKIPDNHYFMLGDNRNDSADSRKWQYDKFVSLEEMLGKVIFSYYPKIGLIK